MSKSKEMTVGSKYGSWEVLGLAEEKTSCGGLKYNCRCACGTEKAVSGTHLRLGNTKKCKKCSSRANSQKAIWAAGKKAAKFYAMRSGPYVKFGVSDDPDRRLRQISTQNPYPTELMWVEDNVGDLEEFYHTLYADRRHVGEWFHFP
jgi:hypothetical protein